jgi:hypothetical protein
MGQPLDKQKAAFYGQFVNAAYTMYKNPGADKLRPEPSGIPDTYELGAWIHMSDFVFDIEEPKFYGIVAYEKANPDSRVIAIRGTEGAVEWIDDAAAIPVPFHEVPSAGRVADGFNKIYKTLQVVERTVGSFSMTAGADLSESRGGSFLDQLDQLAVDEEVAHGIQASASDGDERQARPTVVTGHSLGAALTTLFVMENAKKQKFDITTLCTFASPRVGNMEFARTFNQLAIDSWRIVNTVDVVPKLPPHIPIVLDYDHVDTAYPFSSVSFAKHSVTCWHSMATYLHWLDASSKVLPECQM